MYFKMMPTQERPLPIKVLANQRAALKGSVLGEISRIFCAQKLLSHILSSDCSFRTTVPSDFYRVTTQSS